MMNIKHPLLTAALIAIAVPALQGCLPAIATGMGAGTLMFLDRRTSGAYVEDEAIEWKAENRIGERFGDRAHVNAISFNRNVLLTGEAPDAAAKTEIEHIVAGLSNVRGVTNEVQIAGVSSYAARSNDAYITSKVKARFVEANRFAANHVKVVTEAGTVYLMGLVTRGEADAATDLARTTGGVQKVVRVFEYISDDEARRLDNRPPEPAPASTPRTK
jgi:osmotically-inducible protein OsmY